MELFIRYSIEIIQQRLAGSRNLFIIKETVSKFFLFCDIAFREVISMKPEGSYQVLHPNDSETLEQLIYLYSDALVRYAYCYVQDATVAEDLMEDAFALLLYKKLQFSSMEQIRAWLYKAVHGKAVDYLRWHRRFVPLEDVESVLSGGDMESAFLTRERNQIVFTCLQQLPAQYRQVLVLNYFEEFSIPQISAILHKSAKQVYNLLARAKAALKEKLLKEGFTYEGL